MKHMIGDEANDGDVSQIKNLSQLPSACKMSASLIQDVTSNKAVRGLPPIPHRDNSTPLLQSVHFRR